MPASSSPFPSSGFDAAFLRTIGLEGGYTADPADPGNWTGGMRGKGTCRGTRWGISASAYPLLDIAHLSQDAARAIYLRDYWNKLSADLLPPPLAALAFDAAVNNGLGRARQWLRIAAGLAASGPFGPATAQAIAAAAARDGAAALCCEFQARRLAFMGGLALWPHAGLGWSRRLCRTLADALAEGTGGRA